ncbi:MAG: exoP [Rhodospirillales bacterium]|nr:exoP [Rhodospirillales bacterium]
MKATEEIDFRRLTSVVKRQARFIAAFGLILGGLAAVFVATLPNWYAAEVVLIFDPNQTKIATMDAATADAPPDPNMVRSQVDMMTDPVVGLGVIKKLDLLSDAQFAPLSRRPTPHFWSPSRWFPAIRETALDLVSAVGRSIGRPASSTEGSESDGADEAVAPDDPALRLSKELLKHITVFNDGRSYVLRLAFEWTDPTRATKIANAWAEAYLDRQLATVYASAARANDFLHARTEELQNLVEESDRKVQQFRDAHQLLEVKGATVGQQQLNELNTQLGLATAERTQKEALLSQLRRGQDASTSVLASPIIQRLQDQDTEANRRLADLMTTYGDQHPAVIRQRNEIKEVEAKLRRETDKVVAAVTADVNAARARERDQRAQLEEVRRSAVVADSSQMQLRGLEREAAANRALLQQFMLEAKRTDANRGLQRPTVRLVSPGMTPDTPSFPNRTLLIALGFMATFSVGGLAGFLRERVSRRFVDPASLEEVTALPLLGIIPEIRLPRGSSIVDYIARWPMSQVSEAVRTVRTRLYIAVAARVTKKTSPVILVTSALPNEGKTTIAVSLARSAASSGRRVLLIDADLRRPSVGRCLSARSGTELVASLTHGVHDFESLVTQDPVSGLDYVSIGMGSDDPQEVLGSHLMHNFIEAARTRYDVVMIDSPPVLVVSDAVLLSRLADAVLYVVRWGHTPRDAVIGAVKVLRQAGCPFAGMVISRAATKKMLNEWVANTGLITHATRYSEYYHGPDGRRRPALPVASASRRRFELADDR